MFERAECKMTKVLKKDELAAPAEAKSVPFQIGDGVYSIPKLFWKDSKIVLCPPQKIPPFPVVDDSHNNDTLQSETQTERAKVICVKYIPIENSAKNVTDYSNDWHTSLVASKPIAEFKKVGQLPVIIWKQKPLATLKKELRESSSLNTTMKDQTETSSLNRYLKNIAKEEPKGRFIWNEETFSWSRLDDSEEQQIEKLKLDTKKFSSDYLSQSEDSVTSSKKGGLPERDEQGPKYEGPVFDEKRKRWTKVPSLSWKQLSRCYLCKICTFMCVSPRQAIQHLFSKHPASSSQLSLHLSDKTLKFEMSQPITMYDYVFKNDLSEREVSGDKSEHSDEEDNMELANYEEELKSHDLSLANQPNDNSHSIDNRTLVFKEVDSKESLFLETERILPLLLKVMTIFGLCPLSKCKIKIINFNQRHSCHFMFKTELCEICGERVSAKSFRAHKRTAHKTSRSQTEKCECCDKVMLKSSLSRHILKQHPTEENIFQCDQCKTSFMTVHHLRRHARTHTKEMPYQCHICQREFNQRCNMKNHLRQHTGEQPYRCDQCQQTFTHNVSLKTHLKKQHGIDRWKEGHTGGGRPKKGKP